MLKKGIHFSELFSNLEINQEFSPIPTITNESKIFSIGEDNNLLPSYSSLFNNGFNELEENNDITQKDLYIRPTARENIIIENSTTENIPCIQKENNGAIKFGEGNKETIYKSSYITALNSVVKNDKIFNIEKVQKPLYRKDYIYKKFKSYFSNWLTNKVNSLIKNCVFINKIENLSKPNKKFTGNPKINDNLIYLKYTVKEILIFEEKEHNRQYNNRNHLDYIMKYRKKCKNKEFYDRLITFLNITLEDAYYQFYEDVKALDKLNQNQRFAFLNKEFKKETGISILEKNGFLNAIKNIKKNYRYNI